MTTRKRIVSALMMAALAVGLTTASAQTVWNVNMGNEIDETDNFVGAATENTANSTWNSITAAVTGMALKDSTDAATSVTLDYTAEVVAQPEVGQLEIFHTQANPGTLTLHGLSATATYDMIVYVDWKWDAGTSGYRVTQVTGTGMSGSIYVNTDVAKVDSSNSLVEDTDPANNSAILGNWYRIVGLIPDGSGELAFTFGGDGENMRWGGFQLIYTPPATPGTLIYGK